MAARAPAARSRSTKTASWARSFSRAPPTGRLQASRIALWLADEMVMGQVFSQTGFRSKDKPGGTSVEPIVVNGGKATVTVENHEIIHLLWKPNVRIEAAEATAAMAAINTLAQDSEYPLLVDMTTTESLSRQARSVFTIRCAASRIALLGTSPVDRMLANWSLGVQNLPCATRFFTSRTEAINWLLA